MLDLKVQYFQDSPPAGRPYREEHFIRRHVQMELPVDQTALVLVDLWDNHFIESWLERADRITREAVVPMLHLLYAGFATNWCILNRDSGMRAMAQRGYNMILLRDATMGVEFPDTLAAETATEMAIREVEQQLGFSAAKDDFLAACVGHSKCVN